MVYCSLIYSETGPLGRKEPPRNRLFGKHSPCCSLPVCWQEHWSPARMTPPGLPRWMRKSGPMNSFASSVTNRGIPMKPGRPFKCPVPHTVHLSRVRLTEPVPTVCRRYHDRKQSGYRAPDPADDRSGSMVLRSEHHGSRRLFPLPI